MTGDDGSPQAVPGSSRRSFTRLGVLTLGGVAAGLAALRTSGPPAHGGNSAGSDRNARKIGFVLSHEQFSTTQLVDFPEAAPGPDPRRHRVSPPERRARRDHGAAVRVQQVTLYAMLAGLDTANHTDAITDEVEIVNLVLLDVLP